MNLLTTVKQQNWERRGLVVWICETHIVNQNYATTQARNITLVLGEKKLLERNAF